MRFFHILKITVMRKMNESQIKDIKKQIEGQKWDYWKSKKITDFLAENNIELDEHELYELVNHLVKENIFGFLHAISSAMQDLASDDEGFIAMIELVTDKIKADMAQGPFIDSLISIGKSNPRLAIKIADKLLESSNPEYSSFLIGGASHELVEESNALITKSLSSENPRRQIAAIRALRVIYKDSEMKDKQKIFAVLEQASKSDSIGVKLETLEAFLDFYEKDVEKSKIMIENLAKNYTECKSSLANRIGARPPFDEQSSLHFLEICSEDSNINVKERVLYALVHFAKKHPNKTLEILAKYVIRDGYDAGDIGYVLEELGKTNAGNSLAMILDWLRKERNPRLSFHLPVMIRYLASKTDKKVTLEPILQLIDSEPKFVNKGLDVLLEVISEAYGKDTDAEFISKMLDFLAGFAKKRGIDVTSVTKDEDDKILQSADLIHKIKHYSKPLDYDTIFQNLNEFPNIRDLFGVSWFEQKQVESNRTHPILKLLEQKLPARKRLDELAGSVKNAQTARGRLNDVLRLKKLMSTALFLLRLDQNVKALKDAGFDTGGYSKNLKNEHQFGATLSEIDFVVPFLSRYEVELEPKVNSKKLDAKIEIDAQSVYVEIISPNTFKPLEKLRGGRGVPNRIKGKIYDEFKHQLKELGSTGQPVIVAIDTGGSEINYDFVEDYLFGTLKYTMYFDKEKGEAVSSHTHRDEKESMHGLEPETDLISAVVCYKTRLCDDLSYRTEGKIFENSHAKVPLSRSVRKTIEETLFS